MRLKRFMPFLAFLSYFAFFNIYSYNRPKNDKKIELFINDARQITQFEPSFI